jgi:hypothetical protein
MGEPVYVLMLHVQTPKPYIAIEMPKDMETPRSSVTRKTFRRALLENGVKTTFFL